EDLRGPRDHAVDRLERNVLEDRDRVDAVEAAVEWLSRRELVTDDAQVRIRLREAAVLARAVAAAVVGVDDHNLVAEPRQKPGDQGLARADLDQAAPPRDAREHGLDHPAALHVL